MEYLGLLRGTEEAIVHIMSREMQDNKRYKQSKNAVATTWLVSFRQVVERDAVAADLLRYMSCIEWKAIPHSILPPVQPAARMKSAVGTLCSYSFISRRDAEKTYDMHRLVHLAARIWMCQRDSLIETQRNAMQHLVDIFPTSDYTNRELWREYIPHAARMKNSERAGEAETKGRLCLQVGQCLQVDGRIKDAVEWLEESRDCVENLAEDDPDRLLSQYELAIAYWANGQIVEAVRLLEHVVAIRERVLAEDHPSRLASQHTLAGAYDASNQEKRSIASDASMNKQRHSGVTASVEGTEERLRHTLPYRNVRDRPLDKGVLPVGKGKNAGRDDRKWWQKWKKRTA
ncbi:hypothetical protein LTR85_004724 [Meristemomyces frigidus]|nr:hypothetical protein LTR85_004724 [Meristemomyces frigidus]